MVLAGYAVEKDGVRLHNGLIPEGGDMPTFNGLDSGTDYSDLITIASFDQAGNVTRNTLTELGLSLVTPSVTPSNDMAVELTDQLDELFKEAVKYGGIIGVWTPDQGEYYKAFGSANNSGNFNSGGNSPMRLDHKGRYGSISKMYGNHLILLQVLAGHISLDDTIDMFDTTRAVLSTIPNSDKITIRHLIQMRSGIKDYLQQDNVTQQTYYLTPTVAFDPINYARTHASIFTPGGPVPPQWNTNGGYSNANHVILGYILEWCDLHYGTGRHMNVIFKEDLFDPWGLVSTEWPLGLDMSPPSMRGYSLNLALPTIQATLGPLTGLLGWLVPLIMPGASTAPIIEQTQSHPSWTPVCGNIAGDIADLVMFGRKVYEACETIPGYKDLVRSHYETYSLFEPQGPWHGNGIMQYTMNGMNVTPLWRGWIGGLTGFQSIMCFNPYNGAVMAGLFNYAYGIDIVVPSFKIMYALYPDEELPGAIAAIEASMQPAGMAMVSFPDENIDYVDQPVPEGVSGAWVTLVGGGAGGLHGVSAINYTRDGGGGGAMMRVFVPIEDFGETYSITRGLGGAGQHSGLPSVFTTGDVSLSAGGGVTGGAGGDVLCCRCFHRGCGSVAGCYGGRRVVGFGRGRRYRWNILGQWGLQPRPGGR